MNLNYNFDSEIIQFENKIPELPKNLKRKKLNSTIMCNLLLSIFILSISYYLKAQIIYFEEIYVFLTYLRKGYIENNYSRFAIRDLFNLAGKNVVTKNQIISYLAPKTVIIVSGKTEPSREKLFGSFDKNE